MLSNISVLLNLYNKSAPESAISTATPVPSNAPTQVPTAEAPQNNLVVKGYINATTFNGGTFSGDGSNLNLWNNPSITTLLSLVEAMEPSLAPTMTPSRAPSNSPTYSPGARVINLPYTSIAQAASVSISTGYTQIATYSYTPTFYASSIYIEYSTPYTINGSWVDSWNAAININGVQTGYSYQHFSGSDTSGGGGSRSPPLFPISAYYSVTAYSTFVISIQVGRASSDDTITVLGNAGTHLRITEISSTGPLGTGERFTFYPWSTLSAYQSASVSVSTTSLTTLMSLPYTPAYSSSTIIVEYITAYSAGGSFVLPLFFFFFHCSN